MNIRNFTNNTQHPTLGHAGVQDARARTIPQNHQPVHVRLAARQSSIEDEYSQSKKGYAVHSYFKGRQFAGDPGQSIDNLLRDYRIFAAQ